MEGKYSNAMLRKELYKDRVVGYKHQLNQLPGTILSPLSPLPSKKQRTKSQQGIREVHRPPGGNETIVLGMIPETNHAMEYASPNSPPASPIHQFISELRPETETRSKQLDVEYPNKSGGPEPVPRRLLSCNTQIKFLSKQQ